jgi:glycosyltransferase involved in cell wall biosynthesis
MPSPRFSVIIPAYNEELYLPRLLDSLDVARSAYGVGPDQVEIIVSNNSSTDLTGEIARERGYQVVDTVKRTIAAARNGGAHAAIGDILCFIDADSAVHPDSFNAIDEAMRSGLYVGGATGLYLERLSLGLLFSYICFVPIALFTGMDSGLVFCRRNDFEPIGGYDEDRLYGEDVKFLWELRRKGISRGQSLARLSRVKALGSTRKFDQHGDWHYFTMAFEALIGFLSGRTSDRDIADRYWYRPER